MTLPEEFWWGVGAASNAAEGAAPGSDLADWEDRGRLPPSGDGCGFRQEAPSDLALFAGHGLRHLRYVLDWTRLEPTPGNHDVAAVEGVRAVLEAARVAGVSVWGCLHDGALPGWFSVDEHGFADDRSRGYYWARHVEFVAETFADLVHGWVPVFEPNRWASRGWIDGARPPGKLGDAEGFAEALEGIHLASVDAALRLRQDDHPVASAQWLAPVFPARLQPDAPPSADAEVMADVVAETMRGCWLRMLEQETLVVPGRPPRQVPGARGAFDVIGFTYRHALAVRGDGELLPYPQALPTGADGQVAWAEGLGLVLHHLADQLADTPLLVAGLGLATSVEGHRESYLREALAVVDDAVAGGIDLRGVWWNTPVDPPGAVAAPGLFTQDRAPRPAATLLAEVASGGPVPA